MVQVFTKDRLMQNDTHSKLIGYLLWIVGFTGSHRFYYGKKITGTIWACTLGLAGVGWLIDAFLIPSMDRAADRKYATGNFDYSVAWLLMAFLGWFGIHRFYLGKWATGLLFLIMSGMTTAFWYLIFPPVILFIMFIFDLYTLNEQVDELNRGR